MTVSCEARFGRWKNPDRARCYGANRGLLNEPLVSRKWKSKEKRVGTKIFVNLPVKNLVNSVEFFTKLGFKFDPAVY